jgi:hypothetical protein
MPFVKINNIHLNINRFSGFEFDDRYHRIWGYLLRALDERNMEYVSFIIDSAREYAHVKAQIETQVAGSAPADEIRDRGTRVEESDSTGTETKQGSSKGGLGRRPGKPAPPRHPPANREQGPKDEGEDETPVPRPRGVTGFAKKPSPFKANPQQPRPDPATDMLKYL